MERVCRDGSYSSVVKEDKLFIHHSFSRHSSISLVLKTFSWRYIHGTYAALSIAKKKKKQAGTYRKRLAGDCASCLSITAYHRLALKVPICKKSRFFGLIPNSSNTETLMFDELEMGLESQLFLQIGPSSNRINRWQSLPQTRQSRENQNILFFHPSVILC